MTTIGWKHTTESRRKISMAMKGKPSKRKGKKHSEESIQKMRASQKGKNNPNYGKKHSEETRLKISKSQQGKNGNNWKGGVTKKNLKERNGIEMRLWKEAVFERDNWICQKYKTKGGKLNAHHILNFSQYPELRLAIDNGITLSERAHKEFHKKYGKKNNTKEQLQEFLIEQED